MPLATDDILQSASGSFEGTSGSATLPSGTTAGSPIILAVGLGGDNTTAHSVAAPSGFELVSMPSGDAAVRYGKVYLFLKRAASASETSWTISVTGGSQQVCWAVLEWPGIDTDEGVYMMTGTAPFGTGSPVASLATNPSATSGSYDAMGVAIFFATNAGTTIPTISGHDDLWQEIATATSTNATRSHAMSLAVRPSISLEVFQDTADVTPSCYMYCDLSVFTAVAAKHAPRFEAVSGFEFGTETSMANPSLHSSGGPAPFDAVVGSPAVVSTSPRTGSWCLELSSSAAAECVTWIPRGGASPEGNLGQSAPALWVERFHFYCPAALPSADVEIASVEAGSLSNGVTIWYRSASQKIGVKIGTGSEVLSDAAIAANTWIGVDYRYDPRATTHTVDWQVDYNSLDGTGPVAQTQATATSMTAAGVSTVRKGWTVARTATIRFDDIAGGKARKSYPIGDVNIRLLKVDPAGTPTVSGTAANFQTFTSNGGTMTAFSAANVRAALDDVPPAIGATADGLAQVTTASGDYVAIPMETYTAAPDHVLRAVRWYMALWASAATAATLGYAFHDTTGAVFNAGAADHGFDSSALMWVTRMHQTQGTTDYNPITQAKVDSLEARVGYSTDAAPDVGIHCVFAELVTQPAVVYVSSESGEGHTVYVRQDGDSGAIASVTVVTPSGSGGTLYATIGGSDITPVYVPPADIYVLPVGASTVAEVSSVGFAVDPT